MFVKLWIFVASLSVVISERCFMRYYPDASNGGRKRWLLPYPDPCKCSRILFTGCDTDVEPILDSYKLQFVDHLSIFMRMTDKAIKSYFNCTAEPTEQSNATNLVTTTPHQASEQSATTNHASSAAKTTQHFVTTKDLSATTSPVSTDDPSTTFLPVSTEGSGMSTTGMPPTTLPGSTEGPSTPTACSTTVEEGTQSACVPQPLGMQSGAIPDSMITASSFQPHNKYNRLPKYARLGGDRIWINADGDRDIWIQADLGTARRVTGLITEGSFNAINNAFSYWSTQLKVKLGMSEDKLMFVLDDKCDPKVFQANTDPQNEVTIDIDANGVSTQLVRIYPMNCVQVGTIIGSCVIRFEVLGC